MGFRVNQLVCCLLWILQVFFSAMTVESGMREIFEARCKARCAAKTFGDTGQTCTGPCYTACVKPCIDHKNFYKVKSCKDYCSNIQLKINNWQCRNSCKYLLQLYNAGVKSGVCKKRELSCGGSTSCQVDNECPDLDKCCQHCCQKPTFNISDIGYLSTPTAINSTFIKRPRAVVIKWSHTPELKSKRTAIIFIVEVRHISLGSQQGIVKGDWNYLNMTNKQKLVTYPKSKVWSEFRVLAVNEKRTSEYSTTSTAVYIPPEKPSPPRNFRVKVMNVKKGKVHVKLAWSKPEKSDVPVHRYRVFWSRRLDSHTKEWMSLRVHSKKLHPNQHYCIINGLLFNTTYVFEIQAICRYKTKRLRSNRIYLTARTIDKDHTVPARTLPSVNYVRSQEKGSRIRMPFTEAITRGTSSSVHSYMSTIICLLLLHVVW